MLQKAIIFFYLLGIATVPSKSFCQKKNRIGIQVGPFHTFFYGTPLIQPKIEGLNRKLRKRIHDSWGLLYARKITPNSEIGIEATAFFASYEYQFDPALPYFPPRISWQAWYTYSIYYNRTKKIKNKFSFNYGAGFNYRTGFELVQLEIITLGDPELGFYEPISISEMKKDFGVNVFAGLNYQITDWLYANTKIDLLTFFYRSDKQYIDRMKNIYNSPQFPSRFDLSLNFSIGINF